MAERLAGDHRRCVGNDPARSVLAAGAAAADAATPHLAGGFRRVGRWSVGIGAMSAVMLGATTPVGGLISVLVGAASAAIVHLAIGASAGRPTPAEVADSLSGLGVAARDLVMLAQQSGGVVALDAVDAGANRSE